MRLIRILLAASVAVVVTAPAAYAAPDRKLGGHSKVYDTRRRT